MENVLCILGCISSTCLTRRSFEIIPHWIQATPYPECGCSNQEWAWGQCSRRSPAFPPSWNPTGPDKECCFQNWRLQDPNRVRSSLANEATQTSKTFGTGRFEQTSKKLEWVLGSKGSAQKVEPCLKILGKPQSKKNTMALRCSKWILPYISSLGHWVQFPHADGWFGDSVSDIKISESYHISSKFSNKSKSWMSVD